MNAVTRSPELRPGRLGLGTAQFGMPYGIANRQGQVDAAAVASILAAARRAGIDTLDTAIAYGSSEAALGEAGVAGWRISTKLPPLPADCGDVAAWVRTQIAESLGRLRVSRLHAVLLHRPADLCGQHGGMLSQALEELVADGTVVRVGVSIYEPDELDALWDRMSVGIVQSPYNVLDRRLETSGWLARLAAAGVEVHVRSAFLQGLLLMPAAARPGWTARWGDVLARWDRWLGTEGISPTCACLSLPLARAEIARVIVGVDSLAQFRQLLDDVNSCAAEPPLGLAVEDPALLNPARWPKS